MLHALTEAHLNQIVIVVTNVGVDRSMNGAHIKDTRQQQREIFYKIVVEEFVHRYPFQSAFLCFMRHRSVVRRGSKHK